MLFDLGFASEEKLPDMDIAPRDVLERVLLETLPKGQPDLVAVRVVVDGISGGEAATTKWELVDRHDGTFTSMMRTTGFPTAIACALQLEGKAANGVNTGDQSLDLDELVKRLQKLLPALEHTTA